MEQKSTTAELSFIDELKDDNYYSAPGQDEYDRDEQLAIEQGFEIVKSTPTTLLLDLDSQQDIQTFDNYFLWFLNRNIITGQFDKWPSKTPGHMHVCLQLTHQQDIRTRIAMQLALGSDPIHEMLNLTRYHNGIKDPCRLFKKPRNTQHENNKE